MKQILFYLSFFLPYFAFSTVVLPSCDIIFYKNDTLLMEKGFTDVILRKIKRQPSFKYKENPRKLNRYAAYWELNGNEILLLKVINKSTFDWGNLNHSDTLDLRKAFGRRYRNGKVLFKINNLSFLLHKPFVLRNNWAWHPTYLEDYSIQFEQNKLVRFDTISNYKNDALRLNRYTRVQLDESIFSLLTDSIRINSLPPRTKEIDFSLAVRLNNNGKFKSLEISEMRVTDVTDSIYFYENPDLIIQKDLLVEILKKSRWDEMKNINEDVGVVSYEYDFIEMKLTHHRFTEYLNREKKNVEDYLPQFMKTIYAN